MAKSLVGSINLAKLQHAIRISSKSGKPYIAISLEQEGIYHAVDKNNVYLNLQIFAGDTPDQFGNHATVALSQTKQQIEQKADKVYVGNMKQVWEGTVNNQKTPDKPVTPATPVTHVKSDDDDLPF